MVQRHTELLNIARAENDSFPQQRSRAGDNFETRILWGNPVLVALVNRVASFIDPPEKSALFFLFGLSFSPRARRLRPTRAAYLPYCRSFHRILQSGFGAAVIGDAIG
jgi:hypothetical protein